MTTKFFEFDQNNSGGSFDIDDDKGIGPKVWIEAASMNEACDRAESLGIYFDGVEKGMDCGCCGDRWHSPYGDGEDLFQINDQYDFSWWGCVYIHYLNGQIERIRKTDRIGTKVLQ